MNPRYRKDLADHVIDDVLDGGNVTMWYAYASPEEIAKNPPRFVPDKLKEVWAHVVASGDHRDYAEAASHYRRHVKGHRSGPPSYYNAPNQPANPYGSYVHPGNCRYEACEAQRMISELR